MTRRLVKCLLVASLALAGCKKDAPATPAAAKAPEAAAQPAVAEVTFARKPPVVGARFASTSTMKMDLSVVGKNGEQVIKSQTSSNESALYTVEIVSVEGDAITKGKITYQEKKSTDVEDGVSKDDVKPVANKSYLVEQGADQTVLVKPASGEGEVSEDEQAAVAEDAEFLGADPVRAAIPTRPLKVGEAVPELQAAVQAMIAQSAGKGGKQKISDVTVKLKEDKGELATFGLTVTMSSTEDGMSTVIEFKGELDVRKSDSTVMKLSLAGPMKLTKLDASTGAVDGKGSMAITMAQKAL